MYTDRHRWGTWISNSALRVPDIMAREDRPQRAFILSTAYPPVNRQPQPLPSAAEAGAAQLSKALSPSADTNDCSA